MKKQYVCTLELINFGMDSRGNTHNCTIYPLEKLMECRKHGIYTIVKKAGKGNKKEFMLNTSVHTLRRF